MDSYRLEVAKMANNQAELTDYLDQLRRLSSSDFAALASFIDPLSPKRWNYAWGNTNERYLQMMIKPGQGLGGTALRTCRWVKLDDTTSNAAKARGECPLMLAERLQAAAAFPIKEEGSLEILGLLYIGKRNHSRYEDNETKPIQENIGKLLRYMQEDIKKIAK
ncbi:GAF domain-containing protein [Paenibacillus hexagrammi]|uniref:GAF domain-containing protein n=1 Tax=Paenibacillus hexagrammi TaxID=2908839 RepID=A0ABY3SJF2_9BACL|nr:GAF domain-containing protein [Paenibacillus sp. YPD9-1]UJF33844.1 GAF domain-containing protein [Paenibacillus sp. YPD9-1]